MSDLVRLTGYAPERVPLPADAVVIDADHDRFVSSRVQLEALRELALSALREFHARTPDEPGPDIGRLRRMALPDLPHALWRALIDELVRERIVIRSGPWLHLPEHVVQIVGGRSRAGAESCSR